MKESRRETIRRVTRVVHEKMDKDYPGWKEDPATVKRIKQAIDKMVKNERKELKKKGR